MLRSHRQHGFSLVEAVIGTALILLALVGLFAAYSFYLKAGIIFVVQYSVLRMSAFFSQVKFSFWIFVKSSAPFDEFFDTLRRFRDNHSHYLFIT